MAGSETSGPEHGNADLFEGATWILTPTQQTSETAASRAEAFALSLGAKPLILSPQVHDELVAAVSHLPHLLAVALMQQAGETAVFHSETWQVAAGGFRDMTRLAAGSAEIWRDICLTNASALAHALAEFRQRLEKIEEHINHHDADALVEILQQAHRQREGMKD
jgi:prephenate dehydrogenase